MYVFMCASVSVRTPVPVSTPPIYIYIYIYRTLLNLSIIALLLSMEVQPFLYRIRVWMTSARNSDNLIERFLLTVISFSLLCFTALYGGQICLYSTSLEGSSTSPPNTWRLTSFVSCV